jgi:hypothetical protein
VDNGGSSSGNLTFIRPCYDHDEDRMRSLGHPEEADEHQAKQEATGKRRSTHTMTYNIHTGAGAGGENGIDHHQN